jgi:hypothetical protein
VSGEAIVCRPATPADAAALAELFHLCDRHYWGDKAAPLEEIAVHVRDKVLAADADARVLLAEVSGKAVGFACFALFYPAPDCGGQNPSLPPMWQNSQNTILPITSSKAPTAGHHCFCQSKPFHFLVPNGP